MSIEKEKLIHRTPAFEGRMLHVFDDEVEIHGHKTTREVVLHPGASAIIPVTGDGEILGKLDGGEDPDTCAARELTEETGYKTEHMEKLGYVYTTPGFCNETIHLYLADHLVKSHQHLDQDEFLDVIRLPIDKVYQMVDHGEIYDAKTLAALAMARKKLEMRN